MRTKMLIAAAILVGVIALIALIDGLYIKYAGSPVGVPDIPRTPRLLGEGTPVKYAVLGDSRTVGQGGAYETGIAVESAKHLAKTHQTTLYNFGVSGARTRDVLQDQLPKLQPVKPDVTFVLIGANDVTHRTSRQQVKSDMDSLLKGLIANNCDMKIVIGDAGAMWSVPRIPHPLRYIAGRSAKDISSDYKALADKYGVTFAPLGELTGAAFIRDHANFAADKFHPSDQGYTLLTQALLPYLDRAMAQPSRC